jgi:hypothetical protein
MKATPDDKQVLFIKVLRIFIRPGWGMYLSIRWYKPRWRSKEAKLHQSSQSIALRFSQISYSPNRKCLHEIVKAYSRRQSQSKGTLAWPSTSCVQKFRGFPKAPKFCRSGIKEKKQKSPSVKELRKKSTLSQDKRRLFLMIVIFAKS